MINYATPFFCGRPSGDGKASYHYRINLGQYYWPHYWLNHRPNEPHRALFFTRRKRGEHRDHRRWHYRGVCARGVCAVYFSRGPVTQGKWFDGPYFILIGKKSGDRKSTRLNSS